MENYATRMRKARQVLLRKHWAQKKVLGERFFNSAFNPITDSDIDFAIRHRNFNLVPMINKLYLVRMAS